MGLIIGAVVVALIGAGLTWGAGRSRAKHKALLLTENTTTAMLTELHRTAREVAGEDAFRQVVDLAGTAVAGPQGLLTSELTQTPGVWYQQRVTRRYKEVRRNSKGDRETTTSEEVVSENTSEQAFLVKDRDGTLPVIPTEGVDGARQSLSEFRREESKGAGFSFQGFNIDFGAGDGDTIGYNYEEWVLLPNTRIFVHAEAVDRGGVLELVSPTGKDKLLISTRTEDEILAGHKRAHQWFRGGSFAAYAVAVGLLVGGVVMLVA